MCKNTYHHYPSCGHIANWTVDSCIEFTNALRLQPAGQMFFCEETETTHDLLPLTCATMCFQCEREWQEEIKKNGSLRDNPNFGKTNISIEGLGSSDPVVEVTVMSTLGLKADKDDNQHPTKIPDPKQPSHQEGPSLPEPPLPPPRPIHVSPPQNQPKKHRKRPAPIVTDPTAHEGQPDIITNPLETPSTATPSTVRPIKAPQTASSGCVPLPSSPLSPNKTSTHGIYNWIPVPTIHDATAPPSSSFIHSPESTYSTDVDIPPPSHDLGSISASPLLTFLPGSEEYSPVPETSEYDSTDNDFRDGVVAEPRVSAESFRNGLCITFPFFGDVRLRKELGLLW